MRLALAAALVLALALPAAGGAVTLADLEDELVCPTCDTPLETSNAPAADRMRAYIRRRIAEGATKEQIKAELVADFGPRVLAEPQKHGFELLAWLLPIGGALAAAGLVGIAAWRWSRTREPAAAGAGGHPSGNGRAPLGAELERRLDDELARFDG